jgi:hypothetical protein
MCVPKPQSSAAPPSAIPSMQAATNLSLANAGPSRGAAQLGRLALRIGGGSSAQAPADAAPKVATPATPAASSVQGFQATPATSADYGGVGSYPGSLAGLRFGNYGAAFG